MVTSSEPRRISVLGATGSVGRSTLDLLLRNPDSFAVEALVAGRDAEALARAAVETRARFAAVAEPAAYAALRDALSGSGIAAGAGPEAVIEAATRGADVTVAAIIGAAGLSATFAAVRQGGAVALANKESMVCAGPVLMAEAELSGAIILPVDSEHNAVFQVLESPSRHIEKVTLTASGGPFRTWTAEDMTRVTPADALKHPNWSMGAKITIDSATLMNKGLELIEAKHLFALEADRLDVLVHPQSVIHGMVHYSDGSVLAHLAAPDMRTPISYCLAWPDRMATPTARLDLAALSSLTFERPDLARFPALRLALEVLRHEGGSATVLNAANEIAVGAFLEGRLGFRSIADLVAGALDRMGDVPRPDDIEAVFGLDAEARRIASDLLGVGAAQTL
jgi:1-deoxy-D-xylulose-5-phosphate reductoisomerase